MTDRPMHGRYRCRGPAAFTLIELLAVITIIGILMSLIIGIAAFANRKNLESRAHADIGTIGTALANHEMDIGELPLSAPGDHAWTNDLLPFITGGDSFTFTDPWGNIYEYERVLAAPRNYRLYSKGQDRETGTPETEADDIVAGRF